MATLTQTLPIYARALRQKLGSQLLQSAAHPSSSVSAYGWRMINGISAPSPSRLDHVMRMEDLMGRSREEITQIWLEYHEQQEKRAGSVLSEQEYDLLASRAKESPMFLIPLRRGEAGFENFVLQLQLPFMLLTSLEEYKLAGSAAPAHVVVTHYAELKDSKGLVLVRGDVVHEKGVTKHEACTLLELARAFYCTDEDYQLVYAFNNKPQNFSFDALLKKLDVHKIS